ncbi:stage II sporulation protein P [Ammonifex thiophilus]|uniref:Stage II sporulation protein P n=1 Tax=Ammonifex thiophilus TaxID=444093 RepID=A0A3D8P4M7_9THEO|nr:stage II sporulation protein P [Ammonifex thiophilus]
MRKSKLWLGFLLLLLAAGLLTCWAGSRTVPVLGSRLGDYDGELNPGEFYTVVDEERRVIDRLSREVAPGDEFFAPDGRHYRVERVKGKVAEARLLGRDRDILAWEAYFEQVAVPAAVLGPDRTVAIYHTHSDESYVPTDGAASIPYRGGILKVGARFSRKLEREGVKVNHDVTPHDPHDAYAYVRSRKTATRLLQSRPLALFDVHRDGVPDPDFYRAYIRGSSVGQIRIVVGRQNPKMSANLDFAKRLMSYANRVHPGLVKGIYLGRGNYNQDLSPTALLLECGTHTLTRPEAERGVMLLAEAVPVVLGLQGSRPDLPEGERPLTERSPGVWRAVGWLALAAVVGVGGFLLLSTGSWQGAREKLRQFWSRELGLRKKKG